MSLTLGEQMDLIEQQHTDELAAKDHAIGVLELEATELEAIIEAVDEWTRSGDTIEALRGIISDSAGARLRAQERKVTSSALDAAIAVVCVTQPPLQGDAETRAMRRMQLAYEHACVDIARQLAKLKGLLING